MEDYKLKYLKYKKKYLNLKSKVGGGDMTFEERLAAALALSQAGDNVVPPAARRQRRVAAAEQGWTEDEQLKAALALSEAEDARRQRSDRGAAAVVVAPNAYDLLLEPYKPNAVTLARVN